MGCDGCFGRCPDALGGAFLGYETGQSIMWGREGWGLSLEPPLAPSYSLRQGKGRWYLLLGLSWAQALGVRGPPAGCSGFPGKLCPFRHDPGGEHGGVQKGDQCKFLH